MWQSRTAAGATCQLRCTGGPLAWQRAPASCCLDPICRQRRHGSALTAPPCCVRSGRRPHQSHEATAAAGPKCLPENIEPWSAACYPGRSIPRSAAELPAACPPRTPSPSRGAAASACLLRRSTLLLGLHCQWSRPPRLVLALEHPQAVAPASTDRDMYHAARFPQTQTPQRTWRTLSPEPTLGLVAAAAAAVAACASYYAARAP
mmetsp:Transcript_23352/g.69389  ORF Transcript_23352/g.69389 Transcript_23352/m.69389 type:complete len:205 (-) Transcript_23352:110-724(-)